MEGNAKYKEETSNAVECVFFFVVKNSPQTIVIAFLSQIIRHILKFPNSKISKIFQVFRMGQRTPPCCLKHYENPEHWTLVRNISFHSNINMVIFFMCVCVYHVPKERHAVKIALVLPINALSETKSSLSEDKPIICPFCFHKKQE